MYVPKTSDHIQIKIKMPNPSQEPPVSSEAPNLDLKSMDVLCISKSRERAKIQIMGEPKTSDHIQIKFKIPNPRQEPSAYSKAPNEDLKDMDVLCTFKIKIESQIQIMDVLKTTDHFQIKIKMPKPSQEPPASFKAPNEDLKDMDVLCIFKIKIERKNLENGCIKDQ